MIAATLALSCLAGVLGDEWQPPAFCRGLDCPRFTVLNHGDGVDLREYSAAGWVSTVVNQTDFGEATAIGFERLDRYNIGFNDGDHLVPMTAPILTKITPGGIDYTFSFFTPYKMQDSPPTPSSPDVYIDRRAETKVYVSTFGGYAHWDSITSQAEDLLQKLQSKGIDVNTDAYYFAAYDSPFDTTNRHNEIWYEKTDPPPAAVVVT